MKVWKCKTWWQNASLKDQDMYKYFLQPISFCTLCTLVLKLNSIAYNLENKPWPTFLLWLNFMVGYKYKVRKNASFNERYIYK